MRSPTRLFTAVAIGSLLGIAGCQHETPTGAEGVSQPPGQASVQQVGSAPEALRKIILDSLTPSPAFFSPLLSGSLEVTVRFRVRATDGAAGDPQNGKSFFVKAVLIILSRAGEGVRTLIQEEQVVFPPGTEGSDFLPVDFTFGWDGTDESGAALAGGFFDIRAVGEYLRRHRAGERRKPGGTNPNGKGPKGQGPQGKGPQGLGTGGKGHRETDRPLRYAHHDHSFGA